MWLSAEPPGSPPEPSSVSEPDGGHDSRPLTWTEPEASSGPVWPACGASGFVGTWNVGGLVWGDSGGAGRSGGGLAGPDGPVVQVWFQSLLTAG